MAAPTTLVVHDVIVFCFRCPNETFPWKRCVRDNIRRLPFPAWLSQSSVTVRTKRDY